MTIRLKLQTTLAELEGIIADFKVKYHESGDNATKQLFNTLITETETVYKCLTIRATQLQDVELQYTKDGDNNARIFSDRN